jgi:hypothetical protein
MLLPNASPTVVPHSAPWLLARALTRLDDRPQLLDEIRDAAAHGDADRLELAMLGVVALALRAGCDVPMVRLAARAALRSALAAEPACTPSVPVERICRAAIDALCARATTPVTTPVSGGPDALRIASGR